MFANISSLNNKSTDPGTFKSEFSKCRPFRCFHLPLNGMWWTGNSDAILGRTTPSIGIYMSCSVAQVATLKLMIPCEHKQVSTPRIPLICKEWQIQGNWRRCASRSVINIVNDSEFNNAFALVIWPFEITTRNRHVIKSTCCCGLTNHEACEGTDSECSIVGLQVSDPSSLRSQVWCGKRHFQQRWLDGHSVMCSLIYTIEAVSVASQNGFFSVIVQQLKCLACVLGMLPYLRATQVLSMLATYETLHVCWVGFPLHSTL